MIKKRTILGYLFTFGVMIFCFSAVYSFHNHSDLQESGPDEENSASYIVKSGELMETEGSPTENNESFSSLQETRTEAENPLVVGAGEELRTNSSMIYVVGQYDWITGIVTETVEKFPEELIGFTRQELLVFLKTHPEYGTLLSFSEHAVYLRKSDDQDWSEYSYYLILEEDCLRVYHLDQKTLYLDTGIKAEELTDENRELLEEGLYIRDTSDLFDYLQTVTS